MAGLNPRVRIDLSRASALVLDDDERCLELMIRILKGFGVGTVHSCQTSVEAQLIVNAHKLDLMLVDMVLGEEDGCEWVRWLRRNDAVENFTGAVVMVTDHAALRQVQKARDCGANFMVAKPLIPAVLLDRLMWVARADRKFIQSEGYAGPDRRFKASGPPVGMNGRRADDLPIEIGAPTTPDMSQNEIDAMFRPQKVAV